MFEYYKLQGARNYIKNLVIPIQRLKRRKFSGSETFPDIKVLSARFQIMRNVIYNANILRLRAPTTHFFFRLTRIDLSRRLQRVKATSPCVHRSNGQEDSCVFRRFDRSRHAHINVIVTHVNTHGIAPRIAELVGTKC